VIRGIIQGLRFLGDKKISLLAVQRGSSIIRRVHRAFAKSFMSWCFSGFGKDFVLLEQFVRDSSS
jgi:hypothetical protein